MSEWILSVVGVICLGVLLEIVLPEGQTSKYAKGAFSLLVMFVIIAPIPKLAGADWKLDIDNLTYDVDNKFVEQTIAIEKNNMENDIEDFLIVGGYTSTVRVHLADKSLKEIVRLQITIELGINEREKMQTHIDKVRSSVSTKFKVSEAKIIVEINFKE